MNDSISSDLASLKIDRKPPDKGSRSIPWSVLLWIGVGVLLIAGIAQAIPMAKSKLFVLEVETTEISVVTAAQAAVNLTAAGYVVPQTVAKVGPKVTGKVVKVGVREGDELKLGQVIFELDSTDVRSSLVSAQARVAAAKARATAAHTQYLETRAQWERNLKLAKEGAVTTATADDLDLHARSLDDLAKASEADIRTADAELTSLLVNLSNMTVVAPMDGVAAGKPAEVGDIVGPSSTLIEVFDRASIRVETDVPEGRLHLVKVKGPCEIVLDAFPDQRFRGEVKDISPRLNRAKASAVVKVQFVDSFVGVLPEMAARVSFLTRPLDEKEKKDPPKIIVPAAACVERAGQKVIFVLEGDRVRKIPVTLGPPFGSDFELKEGPPAGTKVIRSPPPTLEDGQSVKEKSA